MINSHTLTCAHCGSAQFVRTAQNEYRCGQCGSSTQVEDDVVVRLEQLRAMQQPPRGMNTLLIAATVVGCAAVVMVLVFTLLLSGH